MNMKMGSSASKSNSNPADVGVFSPIPLTPRYRLSFYDYVRGGLSLLPAAEGNPENINVFSGSRQSGSIAEFHTPTGPGDSDVDVEVQSNTNGFGSSSNDAAPENDASDGVDASLLGAAAAPPPPTPSPLLRRQPTPDEAARYAEVARQLNEVARQIEADYSDDLDQLVESLNLVSEVAYDAFAGK